MSDEIKKPEPPKVLSESDLELVVAGGKASFHDLSITHNIDKSTPLMFEAPAQPTTRQPNNTGAF